jgi:WD40 repeat protein
VEFVSLLLSLAEQRALPVFVVMTMRSDFLGDCDAFRGLPEALNRSQYLVPRLTRRQRREAIEGPVNLCGGVIAPRLVDRLLNDSAGDSDQLPIIQHALMRLWSAVRASGDEALDLQHYDAVENLDGALSQHAEEALSGMSDNQLLLTASVFKALTLTDASNRRIRRPLSLSQVEAETCGQRGEIEEVINAFRGQGRSFLMPRAEVPLDSDTVVDMSHESLIRQWERLSVWVTEEAEAGTTYRRLTDAATRWAEGRGSLLVEKDLDQALAWWEQSVPNASWAERYGGGFQRTHVFLERSRRNHEERRAHEQEALRKRTKAARRIRFLILTVTALAVIAFWQWGVAQDKKRESIEKSYMANFNLAKAFEEKAGTSLYNHNYQQSWLYTLASFNQNIGNNRHLSISAGRLMAPEMNSYQEVWRSPTEPGLIQNVVFTPDSKYIASLFSDNSIRIFDANTGTIVTTFKEAPNRSSGELMFDTKGNLLFVSSQEDNLIIWDVMTKKKTLILSHQQVSSGSNNFALSPDGRLLATDYREYKNGSDAYGILLWNLDSGKLLARLSGHAHWILSLAFSPDAKLLASGSQDKSARIWDMETLKSVKVLTGHQESVTCLAFTPGGELLITGSDDKTIRFWSIESGTEHKTLQMPGAVESVAYCPSSTFFAARLGGTGLGSGDSGVVLWNLRKQNIPVKLKQKGHLSHGISFSSNSDLIVTGDDNQIIRIWNTKTTENLASYAVHKGSIRKISFCRNSRYLASGSLYNYGLWDVETGDQVVGFPVAESGNLIETISFSPDDNILAYSTRKRKFIYILSKPVRDWQSYPGILIKLRAWSSVQMAGGWPQDLKIRA